MDLLGGLTDWMDKHDITASVGLGDYASGEGTQALNQFHQNRLEERARRKQNQAHKEFMQEWLPAYLRGDINSANLQEKFYEMTAKEEYKDVVPEKLFPLVVKFDEYNTKMDADEKAEADSAFEEAKRQGGFFRNMPPKYQASISRSTGIDMNPQGGLMDLPLGAQWKELEPGGSEMGVYFPTADEKKREATLAEERALHEEGLGRYFQKPEQPKYIKVVSEDGKPKFVEDTPENRQAMTPWYEGAAREGEGKTWSDYQRVYPNLKEATLKDKRIINKMIEEGAPEEDILDAIQEALSKPEVQNALRNGDQMLSYPGEM